MSTALPRCLIVLLLTLATLPAYAQVQSRTIAVFGDAVAAHPAPVGWQFLWNPADKVDAFAAVQPLSYHDKSKTYGILDDADNVRVDRPSANQYVSITSSRDDQPRAFIAAYTMQDDSAGEVWLVHGNFRNRSFDAGVPLMVYVNDALKFSTLVKKDHIAALFQANLGRLKKGDTVRVVVSVADKAKQGGGKLHFALQDVLLGQQPPAPAAIISPAMDVLVPQLGGDGLILPAYRDKHQKQCEQMLSQQSQLLFVGDSITARWPQEILDQHFGAFKPVNMGAAGDWVQNVRWRVRNSPIAQVQPRLVVLMIGTNNLTAGFTAEQITQGIADLIADVRKLSPRTRVLVQGMLPRGRSMTEPINQSIRGANALLAKLADQQAVFFLDVGDKLAEPDGSISEAVLPDKLHVAMPGFERWITVLAPVVKDLMTQP